jgi:capsular polysaccharide biosynthesis protein
MEEMKSVKGRIDNLDRRLDQVISEKKEGSDSVGVLLYSNEVQQNLRYYNTLDEKLSLERVDQENLTLGIKENLEKIRQADNEISQIQTGKDIIRTEIATIQNDVAKLKNGIDTLRSEIKLLGDKKSRIDYAQLVKEPTASIEPVSPKKALNMAVALIVGLLLFTVLAFFTDYVDRHKPGESDGRP